MHNQLRSSERDRLGLEQRGRGREHLKNVAFRADARHDLEGCASYTDVTMIKVLKTHAVKGG